MDFLYSGGFWTRMVREWQVKGTEEHKKVTEKNKNAPKCATLFNATNPVLLISA